MKYTYQPIIEKPDTLLDKLHVHLNEDQQIYLNAHRHEKRSILAKKLGIKKYQLNQLLVGMMPDETKRKIAGKMRGNKNAKKVG